MPNRQYTTRQVDAIVNMKKAFPELSIRKIAKTVNIPKSVVGRWLKEPKVWKDKYRFNIPKDTILIDKRQVALNRFKKKVAKAKKVDKDKYKGLRIHYADDGEWEAYSG